MSREVLEVAIVGAGFAGIGAAIKLAEAGIRHFRIFEKNAGVSGTWYENTYPGAACDVPSHLYCYSFAQNPAWSRVYSPQAEIKAYTQKVVQDYNLQDHISFETYIASAKYDEKERIWSLKTSAGEQILARFVVWSVAFLGTPMTPKFTGLSRFKGPVFHSASWDHAVDLSGKNVVLVGSAASALQIGPAIAEQVKSLTIMQRTANYVLPRNDREYGKTEKKLFARFPFLNRLLRWFLFARQDYFFFHGMNPKSWVNRYISKRAKQYLYQEIEDVELRRKLTPNYQLGCKRILIADNFYQMFARDNVHLCTDGIEKFLSNSIKTKTGASIKADVVIMATGFTATEFMPGMQMTGANGASLANWRKDMRALKGLLVDGFPNAFFMLGPNTGLGHSSMILMIESQLRYLVDAIQGAKDSGVIAVKSKAVENYNIWLQKELEKTIWATSCKSWYKREDGFIPTLWPHATRDYDRMMRKLVWEELEPVEQRQETS